MLGIPTGITIGLIVSSGNDIIGAIFNAFSAGTFLYITLTEIIPEEFNHKDAKLRFMAYILGACLMPIALIWEDHWHPEH